MSDRAKVSFSSKVNRWAAPLRAIRHPWLYMAVSVMFLGLFLNLSGEYTAPPTDSLLMDQAVAWHWYQEGQFGVDGQTVPMGSHTLTRVLLSLVVRMTGDFNAAGLWLSLVGLVATFGALQPITRSIFPTRAFRMAVGISLAAAGAMHMAFQPDPTIAIGMALLSWAVALFITTLHGAAVERLFGAALLLGLAGLIHLQLAFLWIGMVAYLLVQHLFFRNRNRGVSIFAVLLGGTAIIAVLLWPMIHSNMMTTQTGIFPGPDATQIVTNKTIDPSLQSEQPGMVELLASSWSTLTVNSGGFGIVWGLFWPVGLVLATVFARKQEMPWFWLFFILFAGIVFAGYATLGGTQSFTECVLISVPLLIPFAVLVPVYVAFLIVQHRLMDPQNTFLWALLLTVCVACSMVPRNFTEEPRYDQHIAAQKMVLQYFAGGSDAPVLTDSPGLLCYHGKKNVIDIDGRTDGRMIRTKFANGDVDPIDLVAKMRENGVRYIYLAALKPHDADKKPELRYAGLASQLALIGDGPELLQVSASSENHLVYRVVWP